METTPTDKDYFVKSRNQVDVWSLSQCLMGLLPPQDCHFNTLETLSWLQSLQLNPKLLSNSHGVHHRCPAVTHLSWDFRARCVFLDTKRILVCLIRNRFRNLVRHSRFLSGRSFDKMPQRIMLQLCRGCQLRQSTAPITKLRGNIYTWKPVNTGPRVKKKQKKNNIKSSFIYSNQGYHLRFIHSLKTCMSPVRRQTALRRQERAGASTCEGWLLSSIPPVGTVYHNCHFCHLSF